MSVKFNSTTKKWDAQFRWTDSYGVRRKTTKRGFARKIDGQNYIREFQAAKSGDLNMLFESYVNEIYYPDMIGRLKENTLRTKQYVINEKLIPFYGHRKMNEIKVSDIRSWQAELLSKDYSQTYLRKVSAELSAILNHAVRFHGLKENVCRKAGSIGSKNADEMQFWTKEEYEKFSEEMMDKPVSYYAFEMLYWCGIRLGELLALTPADFDFVKRTVRINKSYQRLSRKDVITEPKTPKSKRIIAIPQFLCESMQEYIAMLYGIEPTDRIFTITKSYLHHEMDRGAKEAGVKRIRVHDLRHSSISLLIEEGFSALAIAERMGHEAIHVTYRYAHVFPTKQTEMADKLNEMKGDY